MSRIGDLPPASAPDGEEILPCVQNGETVSATIRELATPVVDARLASIVSPVDVIGPVTGHELPAAPTVIASIARSEADGFTGWGQTYAKPAVPMLVNYVLIPSILRGPVQSAAKKARIFRVTVRTDMVAPELATPTSTVVAVGEVVVDPDRDAHSHVMIPLRDPISGAITDFDLHGGLFDERIGVIFQAWNGATKAIVGEPLGQVANLDQLGSYYVTNVDAREGSWSPYVGNPSLAIGFGFNPDLDQQLSDLASGSFRRSLGLPPSSEILQSPAAHEPVLPPRWFGLVGAAYPTKLYFDGLTTASGPEDYELSGGFGLGYHRSKFWEWGALTFDSAGASLAISVIDPSQLTSYGAGQVRLDIVTPGAAAGAVRTMLCIGDSTTDAGAYTQRILDRVAANPAGAQINLIGTRGGGANRHEGRGGWTIGRYFAPLNADRPNNPFVDADVGTFDMAHYLASTAQAVPDIVLWHLGINDVFNASSDAAVNGIMDVALDQLDRMIGITPDASVGSLKESNPAVKLLVATPITPASSQDGFGDDYYVSVSYSRYRRNIGISAYRIIDHYKQREADNVFILPWHLAVDPVNGYAGALDPIHPVAAGYEQMGDHAYYAVNALISQGLM